MTFKITAAEKQFLLKRRAAIKAGKVGAYEIILYNDKRWPKAAKLMDYESIEDMEEQEDLDVKGDKLATVLDEIEVDSKVFDGKPAKKVQCAMPTGGRMYVETIPIWKAGKKWVINEETFEENFT